MNKTKTIIFTGGGTAGSVTPLIAVAEKLSHSDKESMDFVWLGTANGPEKDIIAAYNQNHQPIINYHSIASGKLRRYWSVQNFIDIGKIILVFFQLLIEFIKDKPALVLSAGSFVSVPAVWAAGLLGVPVLIHQQDVRPGLANKLMAPFAKIITVTFEKSLSDYGVKANWTGNIIRPEFKNYKVTKIEALHKIGLSDQLPVVLILGGGTGSDFVNNLVYENLNTITKFCQIIHITGQNKGRDLVDQINYKSFSFVHIDGLIKAYTAADIVISRCGLGVLTELSYLGKPSILIPMPDSHQEDNAECLRIGEAAVVLSQKNLTDELFISEVKKLINDKTVQINLSNNIKQTIKVDDQDSIIGVINSLL